MGSLLIAIGIYNFALYANLPLAGISGICLILYKLTGLPIGLGTVLLNIPIAALCYKLLGHHFFLRSIKSMLISSFFIDVVAPLFPVYQGDRLLAAVCTGVISALGYALIYLRSSSTGGSDFVIMSVKALKPHLSLGNITFAIDGAIILAQVLLKGTDGILYSLLILVLTSAVIDRTIVSGDATVQVIIISPEYERIRHEILDNINCGVTMIDIQTGMTGEKRQAILSVVYAKKYPEIRDAALKIDKTAFIIASDVKNVNGQGYTLERVWLNRKH